MRDVRLVLVTLCLTELAAVLARLRHRDARREAAWLGLTLAAFATMLLAPREGLAAILASVVVLTAAGNLLLALHGSQGSLAWSMVTVALAGGLAVAAAALQPLPPVVRAIRAVATGVLSLLPLVLMVQLWRKTGEVADFLLAVCSAAWGAAGAAEAAGVAPLGTADWLLAPLLLLVGYMLFEQGYLSPRTSSGYVDRLAAQRRLMRETYARLLASEDALLVQDRLIAAGLLALGASHEFRNVISAVRTTAEHGLARAEGAEKDRSLRLVLEHAAAGSASAGALLERLGREGREGPRRLEVRELVERIGRTARPTWRPAGVVLSIVCEEGLVAEARRPEIEQVLVNLLRNAADAFQQGAVPEPRTVRIAARAEGGWVVIETTDNAGGIAPQQAAALFELGSSGRGSTGIGLYLARNLAERNGGSLAWRPVAGGSCFRLELPLAAERGPLYTAD